MIKKKHLRPELREKYVDVPKYAAMCAQCPHYGQCWTCPPYDFDPMEIWEKVETAELLAAFDKYEAELRRMDGLEADVAVAEKALAEITKKYLDMIQEGYEE